MRRSIRLLIKGAIIIGTAGILAGCGGKSNIQPPSPLKPYTPTASISKVWSNGIGDGTDGQYLTLQPTISEGVAYTVSYGGDVVATSTGSGDTLWSHDLDVHLGATPSVSADAVFVGSINGTLYALNRKNGKEIWKTTLSSSLYSQPLYVEGEVITLSHDGTVSAFDAKSGKQIWSHNIPPSSLMLMGNSTPVASTGDVYVGFDNGELWAFNLKTGEKLWELPIAVPQGASEVSRMVDVMANPVISEGVLYVGTYQGNLAAINLFNGKEIWSRKFSTYTSFDVASGELFVTNSDGDVASLNKLSGQTIWEQKILSGRSVTGPAVIGNYIAVADYEGYVHLFNKETGRYADRIDLGGDGIRGNPVSKNGKLYVQTNNGSLIALTVQAR